MKKLIGFIAKFFVRFQVKQFDAVVMTYLSLFVGGIFIVVFLVVLIGGGIGSCRENNLRKKLDGVNANQSNINAGIVVLESEKANTNREVANAQNEVKNTNAATKESLKKDSSEFDARRADDAFCKRFPNDSSCLNR